jgi:hypothetical protein
VIYLSPEAYAKIEETVNATESPLLPSQPPKARGSVARRQARAENGDFTVLCATRPLDPELRRLARAAARAHRTRKAAKQ